MTGRFQNCSANKPWNATFDDCTNGSLVESCLVHAACDNGANCPPQVIDYVSLFEGPYPEGPGSFKGCGGSAAACMHKAGLASALVDNVVSCTRSAKRSEIALHAAEAQGWRAFKTGHGFPALHVQGTYVADAESVLLRICDALKQEADHAAAAASTPPSACESQHFTLSLSLQWPLRQFDAPSLSRAAGPALDMAISKGIGGESVIAALAQPPIVGTPYDAGGGALNVSATFATLSGYAPQALGAPALEAFAQLLAAGLNASSAWRGFVTDNVLDAEVTTTSGV